MKWTILILAAVISGCQGQDFGKWCPNIIRDIGNCTGTLASTLPGISDMFSDPTTAISTQTIISLLSTVCQGQTRTKMEGFYRCLYNEALACVPLEWTKAFADLDSTLVSFKYLCDNYNDVDVNCVGSKGKVLGDCIQTAVSAEGQPDVSTADNFVAFVCRFYPKMVACYQTALGTCPKRTAEILTKGAEYQTPMGCAGSDACSTRPNLILLISVTIMFFVQKWMV